jgi:capsular polysaccharide biosynthesis protein
MIDSDPIAQDAIQLTGIAKSSNAVVAETFAGPVPNTNILQILVTDRDPSAAQALATGVAQAFVNKISVLEPSTQTEGVVPQAPVRIFERAKLPTVPSGSSLVTSVVTAALVALAVAVGAVLLAEYLDITIKSPEDAESRLELPVLGIVPVLPLDERTTARRPPARGDIGLVRDA